MTFARHLLQATLSQVCGGGIRIFAGNPGQRRPGRIPVAELVVAIADLEQGVRDLLRSRVIRDNFLKSRQRFGEFSGDVESLGIPILSVVGKLAVRILAKKAFELFRRLLIVAFAK
ncbi:hypothetical protein MnTg04_01046 [bacterium MnTg04]|nr:hypothetical protein MnTg04_01046 [bacterium MnTg04]